uniref:Uncharacterized protein n=1 Tax=Anguilla anguilla TaxID=7936 RepID=A0A0E9SCF0_ANGAN
MMRLHCPIRTHFMPFKISHLSRDWEKCLMPAVQLNSHKE